MRLFRRCHELTVVLLVCMMTGAQAVAEVSREAVEEAEEYFSQFVNGNSDLIDQAFDLARTGDEVGVLVREADGSITQVPSLVGWVEAGAGG